MSDYAMLQIAYLRGASQAIDEDSNEKTAGVGLLNLGKFLLYGGGQLAQKGGRVAKFMSPMMLGGTFGGVSNVMGGGEGPWYARFGKGYLGGMAGGLGAAVGAKAMTRGLGALGKSGLMRKYAPNFGARLTQAVTGGAGMGGRQTLSNIFAATKPVAGAARNWGETAKRLGMWGLAAVPVVAGIAGGSAVAEDMFNKGIGGGTQQSALPPGAAGMMGAAGRGFANQYMIPQYWRQY